MLESNFTETIIMEILNFAWGNSLLPFTYTSEINQDVVTYTVVFVRDTGNLHEHIKIPVVFEMKNGFVLARQRALTLTGNAIIERIWHSILNDLKSPSSATFQ